MKKVKSINELAHEWLVIVIVLFVIACVLRLRYIINLWAFGVTFVTTIVLLISILIFIKYFGGKGLPATCRRSPCGAIEIHIENRCNGNPFVFKQIILDVTFIAIEEKRDILIDTWLIKKEHIAKQFREVAEFIEISYFQRLPNWISKPPDEKRESFRCVIHIGKLTDDQINCLKIERMKLYKRNKEMLNAQ